MSDDAFVLTRTLTLDGWWCVPGGFVRPPAVAPCSDARCLGGTLPVETCPEFTYEAFKDLRYPCPECARAGRAIADGTQRDAWAVSVRFGDFLPAKRVLAGRYTDRAPGNRKRKRERRKAARRVARAQARRGGIS